MENKTDNKNIEIIDLKVIWKKIVMKKKIFFITLPIVFVFSCFIIMCVPRYYISDIMLAPEMENNIGGGTLGSIASSFGIDLSQGQTADAISPLLYPDLMKDNAFVTNLFPIKVISKDGVINTTYYDYLNKYQKYSWWMKVFGVIGKIFSSKNKENNNKKVGLSDPYYLNKNQNDIAEVVRKNVSLSVDKKTGVITISVQAQDPLICKTLADSIKSRLQLFITDYRTNKARIDLEYYTKLVNEAKKDYEEARRRYGGYADANMDVLLESYRSKQTDLENDMQLKYNTYTTLNSQLQAAKAKVQERTPAFTVIKGANVPIKPAGPKRMLFVTIIIILTFFSIIAWILVEDILGKK